MPGRPDEELVQHARALRGIARALVHEEDVDDVVQETAADALQRQPTHTASVFAWLTGVVRNRARKHHRGERRRRQREQLAGERALASMGQPPAPPVAAAHREAIARLDAALLALPQPYQHTVLLRYYEGLTPPQIAERTSAKLATVKSRLTRGLALLRERLDADEVGGRGDRAWRLAFGVAFGLPREVGAVSVAAVGGILLASKVVAVAVLAVISGLWLWSLEAAVPPVGEAPLASQPGHAAGFDVAGHAAAAPTERQAVAGQALPQPTATQPGDGVTLVGRCVGERGQPLAGVHVHARTRERDGGSARGVARCTTADDGQFLVTLPIVESCYQHMELRAERRCTVDGSIDDAITGDRHELGDIVVPLVRRLSGIVVDQQNVPQPGVEVSVVRDRMAGSESRRMLDVTWSDSQVATDARGRFVFRDAMAPGSHRLSLDQRSVVDRSALRIDLTAEPLLREVRLVVRPAPPTCSGIVVSDDGTPLVGARVALDLSHTQTDFRGRFSLLPKPSYGEGPRRVVATADSFQPHESVLWPYGDAGEVRIVLRPNPAIVVQAIDGRTGQPLLRYSARVLSPRAWQGAWEPAATQPGGRCRLASGVGEFHVLVRPESGELQESRFVPVTVTGAGDAEATVTLWPTRQRRIVVLDSGQPVNAARVQLLDPGTATVRLNSETWPLDKAPLSGPLLVRVLQEATTDASGRALLRGPNGALALRLTGAQRAPRIVQPVTLDGNGDLVVEMPRGATLRGRLVPERVARLLLDAAAPGPNRKARPFGIELVRADGEAMHRFLEAPFACESDGSFVIAGVPAGAWHVRVGSGHRGYAACRVELRNGETVEQEVDVSSLEPAQVRVRILVDGAPAAGAYFNGLGRHALDSFGKRSGGGANGTCDADGRFSFTSWVGDFAVNLSWTTSAGESMRLQPRFRVDRPGPQEILLDLRTGSLDLTLLRPDGSPASGVPIRELGRFSGNTWTTDGSGRVLVKRCLIGTMVLQARPRSLLTEEGRSAFVRGHGYEALQREYVPVGTVTVLPGRSAIPTTITLPASWDR